MDYIFLTLPKLKNTFLELEFYWITENLFEAQKQPLLVNIRKSFSEKEEE